MPTIVVLGNVKIQVFAKDHAPPHFHVVTPDGEATFAIDDRRMLAGAMRSRDVRVAVEWAERNKELLENVWNSLSWR